MLDKITKFLNHKEWFVFFLGWFLNCFVQSIHDEKYVISTVYACVIMTYSYLISKTYKGDK